MTDNTSRISISLQEGKLEIVGSEEFVTKQVERFDDLIKRSLSASTFRPARSAEKDVTAGIVQGGKKADEAEGLEEYENLFAVADDKIQITKDLPGANYVQKTLAAAQLYALASSLQGTEEISFDAIRDVCKAHSCLDSPNFSRTLKGEKQLFVFTGSGKKQSLRLSVPGKKAAKEMARSLNTE